MSLIIIMNSCQHNVTLNIMSLEVKAVDHGDGEHRGVSELDAGEVVCVLVPETSAAELHGGTVLEAAQAHYTHQLVLGERERLGREREREREREHTPAGTGRERTSGERETGRQRGGERGGEREGERLTTHTSLYWDREND